MTDPVGADRTMLSAAARHAGDGEHEWDALADQAEQHSTMVREHARRVGPNHGPGEDLLDRLNAIDDFLGDVLVLVDHVRARVEQELAGETEPDLAGVSELSVPAERLGGSLESLSRSIEAVRLSRVPWNFGGGPRDHHAAF